MRLTAVGDAGGLTTRMSSNGLVSSPAQRRGEFQAPGYPGGALILSSTLLAESLSSVKNLVKYLNEAGDRK